MDSMHARCAKLFAPLLAALIVAGDVPMSADAQAPPAAEESPLLKEPRTPEELFDAVDLMVRLARPRLARRYFEQFMQTNPGNDVLLRIRDKHGPAIFLRLAQMQELRPLSTELLERVNEAFRQQGTDPARLDRLIDDLSRGAQQREVALLALRSGGAMVVPRLLQRINDPADARQRDLLLYTLTRLGPAVVPPLVAAIDAPRESMRSVALEALGWIGSDDAVPYLWHPAFAPSEPAGVQAAARQALVRILRSSAEEVEAVSAYGVSRELQRVARLHLARRFAWETEENTGLVSLWSWSPQADTVALSQVSRETASLHVGSRLARQALELAPERAEAQALFLALALAYEWHRAGADKPLPVGPGTAHDVALSSGSAVVREALRAAIANAHASAARACLQVLGQIGSRSLLESVEGQRSPLVSALNFPDPWVQFTAADVVLQLEPERRFRGNRRVVEILARTLRDDGVRRAVVVDVNTDRATRVAGLLGQLGYDSLVAPTGQQGFLTAAERMDVELVVLELNTIRWPLSQTVANFRADARTAAIPIAIIGEPERRSAVERLVSEDPLTTYVIRSATSENLGTQLDPFLAATRTAVPTAAQRSGMRIRAMAWFERIATGQRTDVFDLSPAESVLVDAINEPDLAEQALVALGAIPSASVQSVFQQTVVNASRPIETRGTAALQLAFHIQRFGLLLSDGQVRELQALLQSSPDPAFRTALTGVLGSLKPNAAAVDSRLKALPLPTVPVGP